MRNGLDRLVDSLVQISLGEAGRYMQLELPKGLGQLRPHLGDQALRRIVSLSCQFLDRVYDLTCISRHVIGRISCFRKKHYGSSCALPPRTVVLRVEPSYRFQGALLLVYSRQKLFLTL